MPRLGYMYAHHTCAPVFVLKMAVELNVGVEFVTNLQAEVDAEAKILASRPLWPRGLNITGYY